MGELWGGVGQTGSGVGRRIGGWRAWEGLEENELGTRGRRNETKKIYEKRITNLQ